MKGLKLAVIMAVLFVGALVLTRTARATTYTYTTINDPNGIGYTWAVGINDSGDIVGYYIDSSAHRHGFLYNGSTYTPIEDPKGSGGTYLLCIDDSGDIVGFYYDSNGTRHGFEYNSSTYKTLDDPNGIGYTGAFGINDNGDIVGLYTDSSGYTHRLPVQRQHIHHARRPERYRHLGHEYQ